MPWDFYDNVDDEKIEVGHLVRITRLTERNDLHTWEGYVVNVSPYVIELDRHGLRVRLKYGTFSLYGEFIQTVERI